MLVHPRFSSIQIHSFTATFHLSRLQLDDLGHLLRMYADWHSRLIPYYNFEQFVDKVERVGGSKRVKARTFCFSCLILHIYLKVDFICRACCFICIFDHTLFLGTCRDVNYMKKPLNVMI